MKTSFETRPIAPPPEVQEETVGRDKLTATSMSLFRRQLKLAVIFQECRKHSGRALWDSLASELNELFNDFGRINTRLALKENVDREIRSLDERIVRIHEKHNMANYYEYRRNTL